MIVAWQFTARECVLKKIRPVGYDLTWSTSPFITQGRRTFPPTQSYRSLSGRFGFFGIPGSKLPGYYHLVPSGQKPEHLSTSSTPHHRNDSATACPTKPPGA